MPQENDEPTVSLKRTLTVAEAETEDTSSLQEYIESEKNMNDIADAVLGACDASNCSYDTGYVFRQALYCCLTCLKETKAKMTKEQVEAKEYLHGICLACSYECHPNHELLELYTKRNFRCDCGNGRCATVKCKLVTSKDQRNSLNKYNHNFEGVYCHCNQFDPVVESAEQEEKPGKEGEEVSEEMNQCTICEDWFHLNHLTGHEKFPIKEDDYEEMICQGCMKNNQFLWYYQGYIAMKSATENPESKEVEDDVDVESAQTNDEKSDSKPECLLEQHRLKNADLKIREEACCFLGGFREALCKCVKCMEMYKIKNVEFLINPKDSITFYEELGKSNKPTEADETQVINNQLLKLNRVARVDFLQNVNDFKNELGDFLKGFADKGEVVKTENINEFFRELEKRKRMKLERASANYYCQ